MKRIISVLIVLTTLIITATPLLADGIIIIEPPPEPLINSSPWLTIRHHYVTVTIEDQIATTKVDQVFYNQNDFPVAGTYIFPLPSNAVVQRFVMWVDNEPLEGKILPEEEAREIYEGYVRQNRDPALLEYIGRDAVRASIFPIPAYEERRIQLEYTQILPLESAMLHYVYPLNTERFSAQPLEQVRIHIEIHSNNEIRSLYSATHQENILIERLDAYQATVSYEASNIFPEKDFDLYLGLSNDPIGLHLLSYHPEQGDDFFMLFLSPELAEEANKILPQDILLVLDTSGSMEGEKLEQAKGALQYVLEHLNTEDRFNIVSFSSNVHTFAQELRPAQEASQALTWLNSLEAIGGTNIYLALSEALRQTSAERTTIIIFLTDGLPTEGIVEENVLLTTLQEEAPRSARIFPFGVGYDVNTLLLDALAENHKGQPAYVEPHERIDEQVSSFYGRIQSPVLTDISLDVEGVQVYDIYPYPLPDLYAGNQLVLTGRYTGSGMGKIALSGYLGEQGVTNTYDGYFSPDGEADFIPRLWAARKIGYLLTQIRLHGEKEEWIAAVVMLSQRYGIVTPYTAFLIEDDMLTEAGRENAVEELMEMELPTTSGMEAVQDAKTRMGLGGAMSPPEAMEYLPNATLEDGVASDTLRTIQYVRDKTFVCQEDICTDSDYIPDVMTPQEVTFGTQGYWDLVDAHPEWGGYFALAEETIFLDATGNAYHFRLGNAEEWESPPEVQTAETPTPKEGASPEPTSTGQEIDTPLANPPKTGLCAGALVITLLSFATVVFKRLFTS